jgi:hypothetical protein
MVISGQGFPPVGVSRQFSFFWGVSVMVVADKTHPLPAKERGVNAAVAS